MSERHTEHVTFAIERTYTSSPQQVFNAWADPEAKVRWFVGAKDGPNPGHKLDFRVGGNERFSFGPEKGPVYTYKASYQDIVPERRIVYCYDMHCDETRISVSLATVELLAVEDGTKLVYTEQEVILDGGEKLGAREQGMRAQFDKLDAELRR